MKLPVVPAIGATLSIAVKDWLTLLRISWLPTVIGYVATLGLSFAIYQSVAGSTDLAPAAAVPMLLLVYVIWGAAYIIVFAGILRFVIHGDKPRLPFYLGFGGDELRIFATWLLYALIFVGLYIGFAIAFSIWTFVATSVAAREPIALMIIMILGVIACGAVYCWFLLRLSLATPAVVGAKTIGIGPSWNKSKGNVWRLLGYWLIIMLVLMGFQLMVTALLYPDFLPALIALISALFSGDTYEAQNALQALLVVTSPTDFSWLYFVRMIAGSVAGYIGITVLAVSGGVAWRYLTDEERPEKHFE
jgi:hypothetical protein